MPVETERQLPSQGGESYSPSRVETHEKERETGWFSIFRGRRFLRRVVPSTRGPG